MTTSGGSSVAMPAPLHRSRTYGVASAVALLTLAAPAAALCNDVGPILAWGLTFGPGALVVALASRFQDSRQALTFVLLSTVVRLGLAGGGALLALAVVPSLSRTAFLFWLACFYLVALAVEVYLTMSVSQARDGFRVLLNQQGGSAKAGWREAGR